MGNRRFLTHNFIGEWGEAANMLGLVTLCTDIYKRWEFVKWISELMMERTICRIRCVAETGVHPVLYDQSRVGVDFSP